MSTIADAFRQVLAHSVRHKEFTILGPSIVALGQPDLLFAKRLAMSRGAIFLMRRAVPDMAIDYNESWSVRSFLEHTESTLQHVYIIGIADTFHIPAV